MFFKKDGKMDPLQGYKNEKVADIVFIGGGPSAMWGVFRAKISGVAPKGTILVREIVVLDNQDIAQGQLVLYRDKPVFDIPTRFQIMGQQIAADLLNQIENSPIYRYLKHVPRHRFIYRATAHKLEKDKNRDLFIIWYDTPSRKNLTLKARSVIIAGGIGPITPKKFDDPKINAWEGKGLYFVVESASIFRNKRVLIVGGGDTALDWAILAQQTAKSVTLIHRRKEPSAACKQPALFYQLINNRTALVPWVVEEIKGKDKVEMVIIRNTETGEKRTLHIDLVVACLGNPSGKVKFFSNWGLEMSGNRIRVNPRTMETNIPGVFAAGDIADAFEVTSSYLTLAWATADIAVNSCLEYLYKDKIHFHHSSEFV